jgi:hypothetical protein
MVTLRERHGEWFASHCLMTLLHCSWSKTEYDYLEVYLTLHNHQKD